MKRPIVVAEVGINAEGSMARAQRMIGLARMFGADYVKFQVKNINKTYPKDYLDKPKKTEFGVCVWDEKKALEWTDAQLAELADYCKFHGIKWFATPRDTESAERIMRFNPPFMKIASGSIPDTELVRFAANCGKPLILSCGMAYGSEIDWCVRFLEDNGGDLRYLLHAVLLYPTPDEQVNLRRIVTLQKLYGDKYKIGFSNHSPKIVFLVAAVAMGAEMVEFHFSEDRNLPGVDQKASIGPTGFQRIMQHIGSVCAGYGTGDIVPTAEELSKGAKWLWRQQ